MSKRALLAVAVICGSFQRGLPQTATVAPGNLQLRIYPGETKADIPQSLIIELANISNHDVRLPQPVMECSDIIYGSVQLRHFFVPLKPSVPEIGISCVNDYGRSNNYGPSSILDWVKTWKVLHPGEFLRMEKPIPYEQTQRAGQYDFWASYSPPGMSNDDRKTLRDAGIDFPAEELVSTHIKFIKKK